MIRLPILDIEQLFYLPKSLFASMSALNSHASSTVHNHQIVWLATRRFVESLHKHVCGHSSYGDIQTFADAHKALVDRCRRVPVEIGLTMRTVQINNAI